MVFTKEDGILIKVLRQSEGYSARKLLEEFLEVFGNVTYISNFQKIYNPTTTTSSSSSTAVAAATTTTSTITTTTTTTITQRAVACLLCTLNNCLTARLIDKG